ncbi:unnamed protein product [Ambrosiozyma monospora]|uniref:mannan endo-1,6-alpha-mannosidase n=1 Tax=Ambrosiozyma monospora TaxID=43982 RepID=A0A9W7DN78_AMBMO|nr:unnamed protein product [Ambrosiozyma monospora]
MIDNWYFCQNDTYEDLIYNALMNQRGTDKDYIPSNQSLTEGNDDQSFWGFAVLEAMERNFTNPPSDQPGWLALAQAVYNTIWARWDTEYCGGGLRWQIFTWNKGYDYKNTISNASLFFIASRLARYTSNDTYANTAETVYDWLTETSGFVTSSNSTTNAYVVYDGAGISGNCTSLSTGEWTYNYGILMAGCAYMYNHTTETKWETELEKYVNGISIFYNTSNNNIIYERQCQQSGSCTNDQRSFKSIFSRCLAMTARLAPQHESDIMKVIEASAEGAASSCSGGSDGHTCGMNWGYGGWDGWYGLGEQISALEIIQSTLVLQYDSPLTNDTGGTSQGDTEAGLDTNDVTNVNDITVKQKDKVGAALATTITLVVFVGLSVWMVLGD